MTLITNTTSPTSEAAANLSINYRASVKKTDADGGAWLLTIYSIASIESHAFTSYRHAQKHLAGLVGKDRIRMVKHRDGYLTYEWTAPWNQ